MPQTRSRLPVLIAGAGPTGLVLAIGLARRGMPLRIVSEASGPGEHSRAMVVHARTLEFYRQFGFAEEVIDGGIKVDRVHLREGGDGETGRELAAISFKDLGEGLSPYPFPLTYPQDDHERLLLGKLTELGVTVEWQTRLTGFTQDAQGVHATVTRHDGTEDAIEADYLCGCDGAHSAVRQTLAEGFGGGTYPQLYFVADVKIEGSFDQDLFINLGARSFVMMLPVRSRAMHRLIGVVPPGVPENPALSFEDLRAHVEPMVDARVAAVNWFATYHVHHRVADRFQVGRVFLAGDAGHLHSPAGGQGMNTGIGDAINLAWKLAMVTQGRAAPTLLDTYEAERLPFARKLVATTDQAFTLIVAEGLKGSLTRRVLMPLAFLAGSRIDVARHAMFKTLGQISIAYEDSPLSHGKAGGISGGDRLPWIDRPGTDNFLTLASLDWQVHVTGEATPPWRKSCQDLGLPLHIIDWSPEAAHAGFEHNAAYLVRPDGYVALATSRQDVALLTAAMASLRQPVEAA